MEKTWTIISKEWAEVFKNRLVLFTVIFLPLIFLALPLITLAMMSGIEGDSIGLGDEFGLNDAACVGLTEGECVQVNMLDIFTLLFMILPISIPVTIAAYSIVGEKTNHSLEPLLATPITTVELLAGKGLAAAVPATIATWVSFLLYLIGVWTMTSPAVFNHLLDPLWLVAVFVVGPLLTILAVCTAIIVSSRVTDPRVAEQLSAVVILPIILLLVGQSMGLIILDRRIIVLGALVVAVADVLLLFVAKQAFQREIILTKWK
ncbi:MAG TPA: ABC transporter permease subunit [Anaerolineae bacterium]|jgi:ABC-2 type transport system permease protein|nr:ABC transporter permease subunit [Anaerolineae bacterium]